MTVKLLTFVIEIQTFCLTNQEVADFQTSLVQILRMRITAMTIERPTSIWTTLDSTMFVEIPGRNKSSNGISTLARRFAPARE